MQKFKIVSDNRIDLRYWLFPNNNYTVISFKEFINNPFKADLIYFSGGADVSPLIYGEHIHPRTYSHPKRDLLEVRAYYQAKELQIPIVGVCRGSQFVTSLQPGGRLVQDVSDHGMSGLHEITILSNNKILQTTSTHHQMMYPFNIKNYELIAVSSKALSHYYEFGDREGNEEEFIKKHGEPEIVYYPDSKSLAIQGHPETFISPDDPFPTYCKELVFDKLL